MLEDYKKKRDFTNTPEPDTGGDMPESEHPIFVIQKHSATNLHYDFRLEMDGVLKSWAIPKEPPKKSGIKRLAIQTEDHPLSYATFEGSIPEGQYGAGDVEIWDTGTYVPLKVRDGEIIVTLHGKKLSGNYVLIKTKYGKDKSGWLFFRKKENS